MDPNIEYERFTQAVYQMLAYSTGVKAGSVKHNKKLDGISGQKHQIDVYWEYEKDGKTHRVAIECKNYSRRISLEKVCAFKGVIDDLDGVAGIMVTKVGYQKGAKVYAKKHGIALKELREPEYGETIIGEIEDHIHTEALQTLYKIDEEWARKYNPDALFIREATTRLYWENAELWRTATHLPLSIKNNNIRDIQGNLITTLDKLRTQIPNHPTEECSYVFKYDDAYLETKYYSLVKILEIKFAYIIEDQLKIISIDAGLLVKAIQKDAQSNETDFVALHV